MSLQLGSWGLEVSTAIRHFWSISCINYPPPTPQGWGGWTLCMFVHSDQCSWSFDITIVILPLRRLVLTLKRPLMVGDKYLAMYLAALIARLSYLLNPTLTGIH